MTRDDDDDENEDNWSEAKKKSMEQVRKDKKDTEERELLKLQRQAAEQEERDKENRRLLRKFQAQEKAREKEDQKKRDQQKEEERQKLAQEAIDKGYTQEPQTTEDPDGNPSGSRPKRKTPRLADILKSGASTSTGGKDLRPRRKKQKTEIEGEEDVDEIDDDDKDETYKQDQDDEDDEDEEEEEEEMNLVEEADEDSEGIPELEDTGSEHVHCANATAAHKYRKYLISKLRSLKRSVGKGTNVRAAYKEFMEEIIQSLKEMQIYTNIENADVEQILTNIPDNECGVWRKLIQGQKTLTEEQIRDSFEDLTRPIVKLEEDAKRPVKWEAILEGVQKKKVGNIRQKAKLLFAEVEITHTHAAKSARLLKELADEVPTDEGYLALVEASVRPLVTIFTPQLDALGREREVKRREISKKLMDLVEEGEIEKIAPEVCIPTVVPTWKNTADPGEQATALLSAMVTFLIRWGMGRPYRVNATATASKYFVSRSTLSKMITGKKFYGGQQAKKMKDAGESTVTRKGKGEGKKSKPKKGKGSEEVKTEATKKKGKDNEDDEPGELDDIVPPAPMIH